MMTKEQFDQATHAAATDIANALHESLPVDNQVDVQILAQGLKAMEGMSIPEEILAQRLRSGLAERVEATVGDVLERTRWSSPFFFLLWFVDEIPPADLTFLQHVSPNEQENDQLFVRLMRAISFAIVDVALSKHGPTLLLSRIADGAQELRESFERGECVTRWDQVKRLLIDAELMDSALLDQAIEEVTRYLKTEDAIVGVPEDLRDIVTHFNAGLGQRRDVIARRLAEFDRILSNTARCSTVNTSK